MSGGKLVVCRARNKKYDRRSYMKAGKTGKLLLGRKCYKNS
jgi:hypothetical protein